MSMYKLLKRILLIILLVLIAMIFLIATILVYLINAFRIDFHDYGVLDEEYIKIAKLTPEAQKFLLKYSEASINVDRSGRLAVDFRTDKRIDKSSQIRVEEYLRLRIFINPKTNRPAEKFIECRGTNPTFLENKKILLYLEDEKCLEGNKYLEAAKKLPEVQKFLQKYPNAIAQYTNFLIGKTVTGEDNSLRIGPFELIPNTKFDESGVTVDMQGGFGPNDKTLRIFFDKATAKVMEIQCALLNKKTLYVENFTARHCFSD